MPKYINSCFAIFCSLILLAGCYTKNEVKQCCEYKVVDYYPNIFTEYNVLLLKSKSSKYYPILSKKSGESKPQFKKYKDIRLGDTYLLEMHRMNTIPELELDFRTSSNFYVYLRDMNKTEPEILFWYSGKVYTEVYYSDDIFDHYVRIGDN